MKESGQRRAPGQPAGTPTPPHRPAALQPAGPRTPADASTRGAAVGLPGLPDGVPADERHETANALHSSALRLLRAVRAVDDEALDLDGPRASLLSVLVFAGPMPVTRLAKLEQVSPPAVTKTVAALEYAGLARRTRSERDRRVVLVSATPAGRRLLERGRAARVRAVADLLADATPAQLRTLHTAATLIAARL